MRYLLPLALLMILYATASSAEVVARVDLSSQSMDVSVDGIQSYTWTVSTGRRSDPTPVGCFQPYLLKRRHYSSKYDGSPMPFSVFFRRGYAIHGTTETRSLGRPVSHACIRLRPSHAARLYALVRQHGKNNTRIIIQH